MGCVQRAQKRPALFPIELRKWESQVMLPVVTGQMVTFQWRRRSNSRRREPRQQRGLPLLISTEKRVRNNWGEDGQGRVRPAEEQDVQQEPKPGVIGGEAGEYKDAAANKTKEVKDTGAEKAKEAAGQGKRDQGIGQGKASEYADYTAQKTKEAKDTSRTRLSREKTMSPRRQVRQLRSQGSEAHDIGEGGDTRIILKRRPKRLPRQPKRRPKRQRTIQPRKQRREGHYCEQKEETKQKAAETAETLEEKTEESAEATKEKTKEAAEKTKESWVRLRKKLGERWRS
ncbi:hypothetical protein M0R45_037819 [Rubus argutus]|uniref:Uncharacterized protein n=1 Tax=Rubus argutus TaxID=59490 RepID=A0AAW1W5I6_RUBAR